MTREFYGFGWDSTTQRLRDNANLRRVRINQLAIMLVPQANNPMQIIHSRVANTLPVRRAFQVFCNEFLFCYSPGRAYALLLPFLPPQPFKYLTEKTQEILTKVEPIVERWDNTDDEGATKVENAIANFQATVDKLARHRASKQPAANAAGRCLDDVASEDVWGTFCHIDKHLREEATQYILQIHVVNYFEIVAGVSSDFATTIDDCVDAFVGQGEDCFHTKPGPRFGLLQALDVGMYLDFKHGTLGGFDPLIATRELSIGMVEETQNYSFDSMPSAAVVHQCATRDENSFEMDRIRLGVHDISRLLYHPAMVTSLARFLTRLTGSGGLYIYRSGMVRLGEMLSAPNLDTMHTPAQNEVDYFPGEHKLLRAVKIYIAEVLALAESALKEANARHMINKRQAADPDRHPVQARRDIWEIMRITDREGDPSLANQALLVLACRPKGLQRNRGAQSILRLALANWFGKLAERGWEVPPDHLSWEPAYFAVMQDEDDELEAVENISRNNTGNGEDDCSSDEYESDEDACRTAILARDEDLIVPGSLPRLDENAWPTTMEYLNRSSGRTRIFPGRAVIVDSDSDSEDSTPDFHLLDPDDDLFQASSDTDSASLVQGEAMDVDVQAPAAQASGTAAPLDARINFMAVDTRFGQAHNDEDDDSSEEEILAHGRRDGGPTLFLGRETNHDNWDAAHVHHATMPAHLRRDSVHIHTLTTDQAGSHSMFVPYDTAHRTSEVMETAVHLPRVEPHAACFSVRARRRVAVALAQSFSVSRSPPQRYCMPQHLAACGLFAICKSMEFLLEQRVLPGVRVPSVDELLRCVLDVDGDPAYWMPSPDSRHEPANQAYEYPRLSTAELMEAVRRYGELTGHNLRLGILGDCQAPQLDQTGWVRPSALWRRDQTVVVWIYHDSQRRLHADGTLTPERYAALQATPHNQPATRDAHYMLAVRQGLYWEWEI